MSKVHIFGDNINTDYIVPGKYLDNSNPDFLATVCMEGYEEGYSKKIKQGDIFIAGENFGCGSSREHAPISIKAAGVSYVIASSFARIFYRNAINIGLPLIELQDASLKVEEGDAIEVQFHKGIIKNLSKNKSYKFKVPPDFIVEIIKKGGMVNYIRMNNLKSLKD